MRSVAVQGLIRASTQPLELGRIDFRIALPGYDCLCSCDHLHGYVEILQRSSMSGYNVGIAGEHVSKVAKEFGSSSEIAQDSCVCFDTIFRVRRRRRPSHWQRHGTGLHEPHDLVDSLLFYVRRRGPPLRNVYEFGELEPAFAIAGPHNQRANVQSAANQLHERAQGSDDLPLDQSAARREVANLHGRGETVAAKHRRQIKARSTCAASIRLGALNWRRQHQQSFQS